MFIVVDVCECPRCADTVRTFVPAAISRVAFVCLKLWIETGGKSLRSIKSWNHPVTVAGCSGFPFHVVNKRG